MATVYPGIIPYITDNTTTTEDGSPRLLAIERRPPSTTMEEYRTGSTTLDEWRPKQLKRNLTEADVKSQYYEYWENQKRQNDWIGHYNGVPTNYGGISANTTWEDPGVTNVTRSESQRGSQAALLSVNDQTQQWPKGSDSLFTTWAFTLSLHSIWSVPVAVIQHGGVVFLLVYITLLLLVGAPLLLLEISLGQYSGLAASRLYGHLCPLAAGLGLALVLQSVLRCLLDLAIVTWAGQGLFLLFSRQQVQDHLFYRDILHKGSSDLGSLGPVEGQLTLVLGIAALTTFIFVAAGTKSMGKVCMLVVPLSFMLLVTLTIRSFLAKGGPAGVVTLLKPDWTALARSSTWLEATCQVIFSLQLGLGAITSLAKYNKWHHNMMRDTFIMLAGHLVWTLLSVFLTLSLLGVAHHEARAINMKNLATDTTSITGRGVWLMTISLVESSLANISYGWLWAGLLLILTVLTAISSLLGYLDIITSSLVAYASKLTPYKPVIAFLVLVSLFLLSLLMTTGGGIHVYHLLDTYISSWPTLLFSFFTVMMATQCHGTRKLIHNIQQMTKISLKYWVSTHLSVLYCTIIPVILLVSLGWCLNSLAMEHSLSPLANFSMISPSWGMQLGWSLAFLPLSPIVFGAIIHLIWGGKSTSRLVNLWTCLKPTPTWNKRQRKEVIHSDSVPKANPVIPFSGNDRNMTEV